MKFINLYFTLFAMSLLVISCESDFQPPHEVTGKGGFVRFDAELADINTTIDLADPNGMFTAPLAAPGGNVTSYDINFTLVQPGVGSFGPFNLKALNSFPATLTITPAEVAAAAGIDVSALGGGDRIDIEASVTNTDGVTFTSDDFTGDLFNPGQRQAMQYSVFFFCPFVVDEAVGEYLIVRDDFATTLEPDRPITAVKGPGENEITFINLFSHPEMHDVVVRVDDPSTAAATVDKQAAWHCDNFGCPWGEGRVDGGGLFFSCSGFLTLDLEHTVDAGSFGTFRLELLKQ